MNGTIGVDQPATDEEHGLDPREAATLLKQIEQRAQRQLDMDPPWLSLFGAAIILIAYGGLSLAAHGEHPYTGPRGPWLLVIPAAIIAGVTLRTAVFGKATAGISGSTRRKLNATSVTMVAAVIGVYTLDGALKQAGASRSIVYGVFDASGPVLVFAAVTAASAAWREDWLALGVGIAMVFVAAGAAFAGPADSWAVIGIGGCVVLLTHALAKLWLARR